MNSDRWLAGILLLTCLLSGCGGGSGSDVGSQSDTKPEAAAQAIGASITTSGVVTVRSGSEVLLTAKESEGYDDPILNFQWRQVDDSGYPVALIERSAVARAFTAPRVTTTATLVFELTVEDSDGVRDTDRVKVRVTPVDDADLFLRPKVDDLSHYQYELVVAVEPGVTSQSEFRLRIDTVARWPDRNGDTRELVLDSETVNGSWPEDFTGTEDSANAFFNPRLVRNIPLLDVDEINKRFEQGGSRDGRLELHRVGDARLYLRFVLESFDNNARVLYLTADGGAREVLATVNGTVDSGLVPVQALRAAAGLETRATADSYYALIDAPQTLSEWLQLTGFPERFNDDPEVAKAIYLNNYDLGFGREMYQRVDRECGNVYSFVQNYPTLENAIQGRGRFATVAMEYAPLDRGCSGNKIVKFLAFVPDKSSGEDVLARSMNFDGRGEKFLPGVCVACHRGSVPDLSEVDPQQAPTLSVDQRTSMADSNSTFIPWDLDSLLYTDTDPALTGDRDRISEELRERYSRAGQEASLRALNRGALWTYVDDIPRYAASIKLIHGWYGSYAIDSECQGPGSGLGEGEYDALFDTEQLPVDILALPDALFDGAYTPCGWRGERTLYHSAVARYCRLCHNQTHVLDKNFDTATEFLQNPSLIRYVFDEGSMPLARVTYDRFWVDFHGGISGAEVLAQRLELRSGRRPGRPVARIDASFTDPDTGIQHEAPQGGDVVRLDGSNSRYTEAYQWQVEASGCGEEPLLAGADLASAAFAARSGCTYAVTLDVNLGNHSDRTEVTITVEE